MSLPDPMTLTDILTAHRPNFDTEETGGGVDVWVNCSCTETYMWGGDNPWPTTLIGWDEAFTLHAAHVVEVMAAANIVAIQLPRGVPMDTGIEFGDGLYGLYVSTESPDGLVYDHLTGMTPKRATEIASRYLAAANAAAAHLERVAPVNFKDVPDLDAQVTDWLSDDNLRVNLIAGRVDERVVTMVRDLRDALRDAEAERHQVNDRIDKMIEDGVEAGLGLKSMKIEDGEAQLSVTTEGVAEATVLTMLDGMADMLGDATNYVEFDLRRRGKTPVSVCVRRFMRPTPHELRVRAEAQRDDYKAKLAAIREVVPTLRKMPDMYRHLVMDTPRDQELHRKVTDLSDRIVDAIAAILDGESGGQST